MGPWDRLSSSWWQSLTWKVVEHPMTDHDSCLPMFGSLQFLCHLTPPHTWMGPIVTQEQPSNHLWNMSSNLAYNPIPILLGIPMYIYIYVCMPCLPYRMYRDPKWIDPTRSFSARESERRLRVSGSRGVLLRLLCSLQMALAREANDLSLPTHHQQSQALWSGLDWGGCELPN